MLIVCLLGRGISLARYIQSFQRSKSISCSSRLMSDQCLTSGYLSDESDDSSFSVVSMEDCLFYNEDLESDGKQCWTWTWSVRLVLLFLDEGGQTF